MEYANKLARAALESEKNKNWKKASLQHQQAAQAYNVIDIFDFDPVASYTMTSLANKHIRCSERCELEAEREIDNQLAEDETAEDLQNTEHEQPVEIPASSKGSTNEPPKRASKQDEEKDFEDFWKYVQGWLSNPAAYTGALKPQGISGAYNADIEKSVSGRGVMESFYVVGQNPDQSQSIYASLTPTPKTASPLPVLDEADEEAEAAEEEKKSASATQPNTHYDNKIQTNDSPKYSQDSVTALMTENHRLNELVQSLRERIAALESAAQENNMLKSSIFNLREEFHKHAHGAYLPRTFEHGYVPRKTLVSPVGSSVDLQMRQLEMQIHTLRLENAKQKTQMTKYRDRWEKLKESAKRKRQQQQQGQKKE